MLAFYVDAIEVYVPNASLVFEKFHIVRHLMNAADTVRKEEARKLKVEDPDLLKNSLHLAEESLEPYRRAEDQTERS